MSALQALFLGLIQGITEFFPISSSAHLKFFKTVFGIETGEETVLFDLFCHMGTLLALMIYFRRDIMDLFFYNRRRLVPLFAALIPLIPFYFLLKPVRDALSKPELLGYCLLVTSGVLFVISRKAVQWASSGKEELSLKDALWVGTFQGAALIPGISRSAATIGAGIWRGAGPSEAVRFSFLLSLPAIAGGTFLELLKAKPHLVTLQASLPLCFIGFGAAALVGLATVRIAIPLLQRGVLRPFAWYCGVAGILAILYLR